MVMSTLFLSMLLLLNTGTTFKEPTDSLKPHDYDYYMRMSKSQKTGATIFMVTGIVVGSITLLIAAASAVGDAFTTVLTLGTSEPKRRSYTIPFLLSLAAIVAAIVLYSAASRNKQKAQAMSLDVGMGSSPVLQQQSIKNYTYPTLSLKIKL